MFCRSTISSARSEPADLQLSALQGKIVEDEDFTLLLARINNARTLAGATSASFTETPAPNLLIKREHLQNLRDALR